ncbi:MAG: hypothetical protein IKO35_04345 [Elusimicrobiaceae bacterium]|nr:hypothetical protein [Elusimicrobiaceae bacterium]
MPHIFSQEGTTIYKKRNEIKLFRVGNATICVKKYGIAPFFNRVFYSLGLRIPKARRAYMYAQRILECGFQTPVQYGYVLQYTGGLLGASYSVEAFIENAKTVADFKQDKELIKAFARYTAQLHANGLMHRDYILNNILFEKDNTGYHFTLIDINRFVFQQKPIRGFLQRMNLMQPFNDPKELEFFVQEYIRVASVPCSLLKQVKFFRLWRTRYSALKRFLKKLPGLRALASRSYRL